MEKVVRPDIVVHEWVQATNYRAQQWFKSGGKNAEEACAHAEYGIEDGDNLRRGKLYGLIWVDVTFWEMMIWILLTFMMVAIGLPKETDYWTPVAIAMFRAFKFQYCSAKSYRRYTLTSQKSVRGSVVSFSGPRNYFRNYTLSVLRSTVALCVV